MSMHARVALVIALAPLATGCANPIDFACTEVLIAGLMVTVTDSVTGAPVRDATVTARDGGYSEQLREAPFDAGVYTGAWERAGSYSVQVARTGYAQWARSNVRVTADECHVQTVKLAARLQPAP